MPDSILKSRHPSASRPNFLATAATPKPDYSRENLSFYQEKDGLIDSINIRGSASKKENMQLDENGLVIMESETEAEAAKNYDCALCKANKLVAVGHKQITKCNILEEYFGSHKIYKALGWDSHILPNISQMRTLAERHADEKANPGCLKDKRAYVESHMKILRFDSNVAADDKENMNSNSNMRATKTPGKGLFGLRNESTGERP